jgi:uncharacterized protein (DUF302 family)
MRNVARLGAALLVTLSITGCSSVMRSTMVQERQSPYNMEETVKTITAQGRQKGWNVSEPKRLDQTIRKHGGPTVLPVTLLELCEPHHAGKLLAKDDDRWVSVFMPCTIGVYEKSDGKVYVTNVKAANLGAMMGGTVAEVMGGAVAADQEEILSFLK